MLYSNERKLVLSGWLEEHCPTAYDRPLKLQKYLFFYELYSKIDGEAIDLDHLRGYKRGPVFSNVYGDYTHERKEFDKRALYEYKNNSKLINEDRAKMCSFICSSLSDKDLSDFTHQLNVWATRKDDINSGVHNVNLFEKDINSDDINKLKLLSSLFTKDVVDNSSVVTLGDKHFVFNNNDMDRLSEEHMDVLWNLMYSQELYNPIFVSIDDGGRLIVD